MNILQFGRRGQVTMELLSRGALRNHRIIAIGQDEIDLREPERVGDAMRSLPQVDCIINGAAYTAVDKAESEPDQAMAINAKSVAALADVCSSRGIPLIHLSTDYVFDGRKADPYLETDQVAPVNAYGRSKAEGERLLRERLEHHVIVRTSWVYSQFGTNFVKTMLRAGREQDELSVVNDQLGTPTSAGDIAETCLTIAEALVHDQVADSWGTYHFTNAGETTWYGFARQIFQDASSWYGATPIVHPIPTSAYPTPAPRPKNSRLDCQKIETTFNVVRRPWPEALTEVLNAFRKNQENSSL